MMTRKDYKAIAQVLQDSHYDQQELEMYSVVVIGKLADYMAQDNPRFDRAKFIAACYGEK